MPESRQCFDLLLHENSQLHDNLQRTLDAMIKLGAFVFPVVATVFAALLKTEFVDSWKNEWVAGLFCIVLSVILIIFNYLWTALGWFGEYKYCHVLPKLYTLSGRTGDRNYGEFLSAKGTPVALSGMLLLQVIIFVAVLGAVVTLPMDGFPSFLHVLSYLSAGLAVLSTFISVTALWKSFKAAKRMQHPEEKSC
jgi:hypothetical protein